MLSVVTFLWLLLTAHCSCLTTAKKLAVFGMIHHLSIDWLLRWWIHGVCAECWNPVECVESNVLSLSHTHIDCGGNRAKLLNWAWAWFSPHLAWCFRVLGGKKPQMLIVKPLTEHTNVTLISKLFQTHTHPHTRHLLRSHLHTITQQPLQSHTYSSALSKLLLSYLIIHMLNSHTDFRVVNQCIAADKINALVRLDPNILTFLLLRKIMFFHVVLGTLFWGCRFTRWLHITAKK